MINRRTVLRWLGWSAAAVVGVDDVSSAAQSGTLNGTILGGGGSKSKCNADSAELPPLQYPIGWVQDRLEAYISPYASIGCPSQIPDMIVRRMIFDGEKFVSLESPEGANIMNTLLVQNASRR